MWKVILAPFILAFKFLAWCLTNLFLLFGLFLFIIMVLAFIAL